MPSSGCSAASHATQRSKYGPASAARPSSIGKTGSERSAVFVTPPREAVTVTAPVVSALVGSAVTQTSPTTPGASSAGEMSTTVAFVVDASMVTGIVLPLGSSTSTRKQ
jgi:hypothetical protein